MHAARLPTDDILADAILFGCPVLSELALATDLAALVALELVNSGHNRFAMQLRGRN